MKKYSKFEGGFSLVEVALALGIAAFCLVTLMALLPVGIQHYQQADSQSTMVNLATMVARDLQVTSSSSTTSPRFGFTIPIAGGSASATPSTIYVDAAGASPTTIGAAPNSNSLYRISVYFNPPAISGQKMATMARIWITFPAKADSTPGTDAKNYTSMFETTIALNRN
jgi:uncharacterized protein (TIGR02598 family)